MPICESCETEVEQLFYSDELQCDECAEDQEIQRQEDALMDRVRGL